MAPESRDPEAHDDTAPAATTPESDPGASSGGSAKRRAVNVGDVLGRYELVEEIGEGGMATVFRARDRELRRDVAVKVLFPHLAKRIEIVRRFHREARAAALLEHPNILRIYDVGGGEGDDPPYIVMELIRGPTLGAEIEARGGLLAELAACVGALLADALAAAHAAGVIHRDVKPSNVLIAPGGRLLLADFGVAHVETEDSLVTRTGALLGTPAYMSPEQATGDTTTARSDLYSLGATLYQLATGCLPYAGPPAKVIAQITTGNAPPAVRRRAAVGPDLSRAIERMMELEVERRPASAVEVAHELRAIAAAGGLGDPGDELAAYFADPAAVIRAREPTVVAAVVAAAEQAIGAGRLPRAMALADRASALAPDDPAVKDLVHEVTRGGRARRRRRAIAIGAAAVVAVAGLGASLFVFGNNTDEVEDEPAVVPVAAVAPVARDAAAPVAVAVALDAAAPAPTSEPIDAARAPVRVPADAAVVRASVVRKPASDAGVDAAPTVQLELDAAVQAIVVPADAAPPETGWLVVHTDLWCELEIDRAAYGKDLNHKKIKLAVGKHAVHCEQPNTDRKWTRVVEIDRDQTATVSEKMKRLGAVRIATTRSDDVKIGGSSYHRGDVIKLDMPSRLKVVDGGIENFVDFSGPCTLHDANDQLACDPTP